MLDQPSDTLLFELLAVIVPVRRYISYNCSQIAEISHNKQFACRLADLVNNGHPESHRFHSRRGRWFSPICECLRHQAQSRQAILYETRGVDGQIYPNKQIFKWLQQRLPDSYFHILLLRSDRGEIRDFIYRKPNFSLFLASQITH